MDSKYKLLDKNNHFIKANIMILFEAKFEVENNYAGIIPVVCHHL